MITLERIYIYFLLLLLAAMPRVGNAQQAQPATKKVPVSVVSDKLDYDRTNDVYVAEGHVKIEQEGIRLEADKVVLNNKTGEATAEGNVYLQDKGEVVRAEKLRTNLTTREGTVTKGDVFMKKDNFHVKGDLIERRSETVYHIENARFTSCNEDEWLIKADEMNVDMDRYATGSGVSFNVAGVPVMYTPYFLFPVRRQTGFLLPQPGRSSKDGLFVDNAFFWAISDYKDLTISSDYRTRTGHGTGLEYRYENSRESSGQVYYKYWDMFHTSGSRWDFRFQHQEEFAEDLSARADINLVSDDLYFYDLDKKLENRSRPYLDSNAFYVERWNTASLYLMGQYSIDLTKSNAKTVQKLPELRYTIYDESLAGPLHLSFEGSAANFTKQTEDGARRVDFNPQLSAAFGSNGLSLTPRAGIRATFYDRSANTVEPAERKYAYAGADINARISRVFGSDSESGIGRMRHSIEPTLSYNYIPHIEQGSIPQFDSLDSVSAQNQTSFSLINRVTAHYKESKEAKNYTSFDLMVLKLSQTYDLNVRRDELRSGTTTTVRPRSDVIGEIYLRTPKLFTLSASGNYNTYQHVLSSHSESVALNATEATLAVSHQFLRDPETEYLIASTSFKLGSRWNLGTQWWRDMQTKKTTQSEYKVQYNSQCWGIGVTYTTKPGETQYTFMLDLKGLGSRGSGK